MYLSLDKGDHIPFLAGTPYLMYYTPKTYNQKRFASFSAKRQRRPLLWHDSEPFFDVSNKDACGLLPCVVS